MKLIPTAFHAHDLDLNSLDLDGLDLDGLDLDGLDLDSLDLDGLDLDSLDLDGLDGGKKKTFPPEYTEYNKKFCFPTLLVSKCVRVFWNDRTY